MKLLIVAEAFPFPAVTGDRIRVFNLIKQLSARHEIYLTAFLAHVGEEAYLAEMKKYCREVHTVTARRISKWRHLPGVLKAVASGVPLDAKFVTCEPMRRIIRDILERISVDLVQVEHSFMAAYLDAIPRGYPAKTVLTLHNVCYVQYRRMFQTESRLFKKIRNLLNWLAMETWEARMAARFDQCVAVSEADKALLLKKNPLIQVAVVPNGVDAQAFRPLGKADGADLIFTGKMSYRPNSDAALYFLREVFPRIKAKLPTARVFLIGGQPPETLRVLDNGQDIRVTGFVEDLLPFYAQSQAAIIPLRAGGGTRLKILEAMALGRPVVTTTLGCEGIEAEPGKHALFADDPQAFADACLRVMTEPETWTHLARHGRELVERRYAWPIIGAHLETGYLGLVKEPKRGGNALRP